MAGAVAGFHGHTEVAKAVAALQGPDDLAEELRHTAAGRSLYRDNGKENGNPRSL